MKIPVIIFVFLTQSVIVQAQHVFNSLHDVWEYSLSNNPENTIYQLRIEQAEQDKKTATSYLYPKAAASFSGQRSIDIPETPVPGELIGKPGETVYMKFGQNYSFNSGISLSKTLLDWQAMAQSKIAKLNVSLTEAHKDYFEQTLKEQVAQVYYAALTAKKAVKIGERDFEIADSICLLSQERFEQGLIDALVFNQAKINKNSVFEKLERNKLYQSQCIYNLKLFLGIAASDSLILTEDNLIFDEQNTPDYKQLTSEKYIKIYSLQSEISGTETKKALARFTPKIDIAYYYGTSQYQDDFALSFKSSDWKPNSYLGLSLSIPVFTGFSNKVQYNSAKISRTITQKKLQDETRKSAINDSILLNNYFSSAKLIQVATETYKISGNCVELAAKKYAQGLINLDEYLKIFDDYLTVENQYFNSLSDYLINKATIDARKK